MGDQVVGGGKWGWWGEGVDALCENLGVDVLDVPEGDFAGETSFWMMERDVKKDGYMVCDRERR